MRHRVVTKTLGRDSAHRKALLRNLSDSLVMHESVTTTLAKAKYVRPYIEKLISKAKKGSDFVTVKYVRNRLVTEKAARKLFEKVAPLFAKRPGGYTRIVKTGTRDGDNSLMARIEFVERIPAPAKPEKKKVKTKKEDEK